MPPFDLAAYQRLRTSRHLGAVVHHRERTDSTMDDARTGADASGASGCGDAYVAGEQTRGRGRQGRTWVSAAAAGLYVTYHLCPRVAEHAPLIGVAGALAVADAVSATSGLDTELKWPNDVLCDGRKLAGLLAEARHGERLDVFLGIGINVRSTAELPREVAEIATSIEGAGAPPPSLEALLAALSVALETRIEQGEEDPPALVAEWRSRLVTIGQRVRLAAPSGVIEGDAVDVTARGELLLRLADGSTVAHAAGDVTTL